VTLGAVLTGGQSRRMGRDKALIEVDGLAMVDRVAGALRAAGCDPVVAIGPAHLRGGVDHRPDVYPGDGPLGGILSALAGSSPALVVACDLPWIDVATVRALLAVDAATAHAVVARTDRLEPLCAIWRPAAFDILSAHFRRGERSVLRAMEHLEVITVDVAPTALRNVNTPNDLLGE
jgi:molybdopterin-guanine dinucleotide biosynthesis protein A